MRQRNTTHEKEHPAARHLRNAADRPKKIRARSKGTRAFEKKEQDRSKGNAPEGAKTSSKGSTTF